MTDSRPGKLQALARKLHSARQARKRKAQKRQRQMWQPETLEARQVMTGDITGVVFNDANANGVDDPAENGLAGWTVFVDTNNDSTLNAGEPTAVTDDKGRYALLGLPDGTTTVFEIPQPGFSPTPGFTDHQTVAVRNAKETRVKFPNVTAPVVNGQVVGTVFEDDNENGTKDSGEHGLAGWTLFIDANGDGSQTAGEPTAITDADGDYLFDGIPAGPATVYEIPQAGYAPIVGGLFPTQGASDHHLVNVTAGSSVRSDFSNLIPPVGTIQGTVWDDANGDGLRGLDEAPLSGRTVYVDLDSNGTLDTNEPFRTSDANGNYSLVNIHTGSYRLTEVLPTGRIASDGRASSVTSTVFRGSINTVDFFELTPTTGSISGSLWNDADGNGIRSITETALTGWQVYDDLNANAQFDSSEPNALTDVDGNYTLPGIPYGTATVRTVVPSNWLATNPATGAATIHLLNGENRTSLNFGIRERIGKIQGVIWNDANGDRLHTAGESGLANWTVYLDLDLDGNLGAAEPATLTDANGQYSFASLPVGSYRVSEINPSGWINSAGTSAFITTSVVTGGVHDASFLNLQPAPGSVSGTVWSDIDSNGVQAATEPGLAGWQVYVDVNSNGTLDAGEPSATSDATGSYTISDVSYGNTRIRQVNQLGYVATDPVTGSSTLFLLNGENRTGVNFGNHELTEFTISGTVFNDTNHDGLRDPSETGISGVTIYLDTNNNGTLDATEPTSISSIDLFYTPATNEIGNYTFTHLARGTYHVREIVPAILDGTPAAAREQIVSVGPVNPTGVDFANVYRANEIHGVVFDDTDADHVRDANEYARPGVPIYIDLNRNDVYDVDEPHTTTADDGSYAFLGLTPGAYIVREESGSVGPHTYPTTGGGILWPTGVDHPAIGNVTPTSISTSLANGEAYTQTVSLTLPGTGSLTNLVDVFLLFDDTGSFTANSPIVRDAFPTIINTLQSSLPGTDLGFGVGRLEEYANYAFEFATGRPFILNQPIVASSTPGFAASIQSALDRMAPGYGGDTPETDIEALYQLVTGRGFDGNNNGTVLDSGVAGLAATQVTPGNSGDVPSFASFTPDPANNVLPAAGNVGGGGFRTGALPIVLLATDTGFAYQPKGETTIIGTGGLTLPISDLTSTSRPTTPFSSGAGIQETITGLNALGALVIGLGTNPEATFDPRLGLESLSRLTGAVNRSTTTVNNGTADPISPGDPFYFQISSGFGGTVADGVINAIQNAVTNTAMDITIRASDPRVQIVNHTGTLSSIGAGQTASFDIEFVGDGRPHRFDLEFVRAGTNVVLGSIPVVLGTPIVGDGYQYDELQDGEIHQSSHFGNYVANVAPSFAKGSDTTIPENAGVQTIPTWATSISPGPATESGQTVNFLVSTDNPSLFSDLPAISADGTLTFTPAPDASGTALVTVRLQDNGGVGLSGADTSAPQTFLITVTPINTAPVAANDTFATNADSPISILANGVLANDIDADGDTLTAVIDVAPSNGTVVLESDGSFVYTPVPGFVGSDSFTYRANDGQVDSNVATVTITIARVNHIPFAADDSYQLSEDGALQIDLPGVLANDTDADLDGLTAVIATGPTHGTLTLNADGSFNYVPDANFNGSDSFSYVANDGTSNSNAATVSLSITPVNDTPTASPDTFAAIEDSPLAVTTGVLANDSDIDGDSLTASIVDGPTHGILTFNADGSFAYVPAPNFNGVDTFRYVANDGTTNSDIVTVTISIAAVNDTPVAVNDSYTTLEDTPLTITIPGVLANDSDVDGDILRAVRITGPTHGTVTLTAGGAFTYTPAVNYNGVDSFTYSASDGILSSTGTVTLNVTPVNDAPVASGDTYSTNQGTTLNVVPRGLLVNDADADGDALTANLGTGPSHGSLVLNSDGSFSYTPIAGFSGTDTFTYRASDATASSALATVNIVVVPTVPATKFFVVDTDSRTTYQYAANGAAISSQALNKSDSKPRGIASNSTGTMQWVMDGGGSVFVYDNLGNLAGQWTPQNVGKPEGIAVSGNDLWIVDPNQDRVFKFTGGANLRTGRVSPSSSFALNAGNLNATDITTDGSHLWVVNDTTTADKVFRYSMSGVLEGSWTISATNPTPTGLTIDPNDVNHIWIVDASTDRIYQYDGAASRISGSQEPSASMALAATNANAQGIADPRPIMATTTSSQTVDAIFSDRRGRSWQLHGDHHDHDLTEVVASGVSGRSYVDTIDSIYANMHKRGRRA